MPKVGKSLSMTLFANQQIKPKSMTWKGKIVDFYPLYASIIYGGSACSVKIEKSGNPILVTPELEQLQELELKQFTENFRDRVFDIIIKEVARNEDKFSLSGISARLKRYDSTVSEAIEELTIKQASKIIIDHMEDKRTDPKGDSYVALFGILLVNNQEVLRKTTVYDWIYGDGKSALKAHLKSGIDFGQGKRALDDTMIKAMVMAIDLFVSR